jgi:hypothetical protein
VLPEISGTASFLLKQSKRAFSLKLIFALYYVKQLTLFCNTLSDTIHFWNYYHRHEMTKLGIGGKPACSSSNLALPLSVPLGIAESKL